MEGFTTFDFNISDFLLAIRVEAGHGERFHKDRPSHGLVYILDGTFTYRFDNGHTEIVGKDQLLYLPKFSTYEVTSSLPCACMALNFLLFEKSITFPPFQLSSDMSKCFEKYFLTAEQIWRARPVGYRMKCKSLLYDLLFNLQNKLENAYMPAAQRNSLKIAVDHIRQHYLTENIRVSQLAELAGISPEYLRTLFQKAYGMSPHQYISDLKTTRAKELLRADKFSINEIAESCGYNSAGYFCREFKKQALMTPLEYKKRC